jgi:hypothetical protein
MVLCVWKKNAFKQNSGDIDQYEELRERKEGCQRKQFVLLKQAFVRFKEWKVWYLTDYHQITSIVKMQSNTTINICIAKRCFYIDSLNNDMFRLLYRPSSGCTLSYEFFKANYTINNVFLFCRWNLVHIYKICIKNNYNNSRIKKNYFEIKVIFNCYYSYFKYKFYRFARDLVDKNKKHFLLYSLL